LRNKNIYSRELLIQVKKIFHKCIETIYPSTCPICTQVLDNKMNKKIYICENCKEKLSYIESPRCLKCGKPVDNAETEFCYDCSRVKHIYFQGVGVWAYTDEIKNSIYQFKYHNKREYGEFYGLELKNRYESIIKNWDADVLIPVPLHKSKLRKRGYNQADIIAKSIGKLLEIPVDSQLLNRNKKTLAQKELNDKERMKNLENAFNIGPRVVKYRRLLS